MNNEYSKAYARMGSIYMIKKDYFNANLNLTKACELEPENVSYKETLEQCKKASGEEGSSSTPSDMPNFGGIDFNQIMNDPMVVNMAKNFMQSPQMQDLVSNLMNNQGSEGSGSNPLENLMNA